MNEPEMVRIVVLLILWSSFLINAFLMSYLIQVHYIMDEMLLNGCIVDTNKANILEPVQLLETIEK
jgi:AP-4 complex subunit sigma-1